MNGQIETRLFRYFVALAEEQHFGRAAANLDISPPTLTNQIQKLELRLGAKLFERRGNTNVELTETGKHFLTRARNVLREAHEAEAVARQAARGEVGRIEIGFMMTVSLSGLIERFIGTFQRANPGIEVVLHNMVTTDQINGILARTIDFGFMRPLQRYPSGLRGFIVYQQPLVLALPSDHPLARHERIPPSMLKDESFINTAPAFDIGFWKHTEAIAELGHFTPRILRRVKDMVSSLSCVSAGQGVAVVSKALAKLEMPNVVYREFAVDTPPMAAIAFVYRSDDGSPAAQLLIKSMRAHALPPTVQAPGGT